MDDLISRQAVLNELPHALWGKEWDEALAKAIIESVPTIDPVKLGRWVADETTMRCSECEKTYWFRFAEHWNYCPNCGAKMESADDV